VELGTGGKKIKLKIKDRGGGQERGKEEPAGKKPEARLITGGKKKGSRGWGPFKKIHPGTRLGGGVVGGGGARHILWFGKMKGKNRKGKWSGDWDLKLEKGFQTQKGF